MSRAPVVQEGVVLPPPPAQYDRTDQLEMRRLITDAMRRLVQWGVVTGAPAPVTALGALTGAADMVPYFTGVSAMALASLTPYARTILGCIDAAAVRTILGLGTLATLSAVTEAQITLADNTTDNVSSTKHGLAPKSPADATKFMNGAATPTYAQVKDADLAVTDVTTNNVSTSTHGFAPKLSGVITEFLNGTGAFSVPPSSGGTPPTFPITSGVIARYSAKFSTLTVSTDQFVAAVSDLSGNARTTDTATGTARPRLLASAFNRGYPALRFNGSSQRLTVSAMPSLASPLTCTIVAVIQNWTSGTVNRHLVNWAGNPIVFLGTGPAYDMYNGTTITPAGAYTQVTSDLPPDVNSHPVVMQFVFDGATPATLMSVGNTEYSGGSAGTGASGATNSFTIGSDSGGTPSNFAGFLLAELAVFDHVLTSTERQNLRDYYANAAVYGVGAI